MYLYFLKTVEFASQEGYTIHMTEKTIKKLIEMTRDEAFVKVIDRQFIHCSIIMRRSKVIAVGFNERRTHPLAKKYGYRDDFVHAELDAMLSVPKNKMHNLDLVNFRFNPAGELRMAKPCDKCFPWVSALFRNVFYSDPDGNMVRIVC